MKEIAGFEFLNLHRKALPLIASLFPTKIASDMLHYIDKEPITEYWLTAKFLSFNSDLPLVFREILRLPAPLSTHWLLHPFFDHFGQVCGRGSLARQSSLNWIITQEQPSNWNIRKAIHLMSLFKGWRRALMRASSTLYVHRLGVERLSSSMFWTSFLNSQWIIKCHLQIQSFPVFSTFHSEKTERLTKIKWATLKMAKVSGMLRKLCFLPLNLTLQA